MMINKVFLISFLFIIMEQVPGQKVHPNPYNVKSGIIEYSYSGNKVGKGTLYFDDYGRKSALMTDAIEDGEKRRSCKVRLDDAQYMWDPETPDKGMKFKNTKGDNIYLHESMYTNIGLVNGGTEIFLDKQCTVLQGKIGKVLLWNGITMLLDLNLAETHSHEEVTDIQIDIPVSAKYFAIPKKVKFMGLSDLD